MVGFGCAYGASAVLHTSLVLEDAEISPPRWAQSVQDGSVVGWRALSTCPRQLSAV